jgi:hypothetical protein
VLGKKRFTATSVQRNSTKARLNIVVLILTDQISSAVSKDILLCIIVIIVTHHIVQDFIQVDSHLIGSMSKTAKKDPASCWSASLQEILGTGKRTKAQLWSEAPFPLQTYTGIPFFSPFLATPA